VLIKHDAFLRFKISGFFFSSSECLLCTLQVTAVLSFAAASSAGGVVVLFDRDVHFCRRDPELPCGKFEVATAFAFLSCAFCATSAIVMFCLLASL
jgi:hypothetical protein